MKLLLAILIIVSTTSSFAAVNVTKLTRRYMYNWSLCDLCGNPESAYYDPESKMLFISNVEGAPNVKDGKGSIQMVNASGKMLNAKWVTGLNAPKGMRAHKGVLWVSDIDQVLSIDIRTGQITRRLKVDGAKFLNDVAIDSIGTVFVSDMLDDKIYQIINNTVGTFFASPLLEGPNGLLVQENKLVVACWGKPDANFATKIRGRLMKIDLKTKAIEYVTKTPLGNLDGVEIDGKGNFLVSDWMAGKVFSVTAQGKTQELFTGMKGSADIGFIPDTETLVIPRMNENQITAFNLAKYPGYRR
jgi:sugar lactone lactonase YvrE